MLCIMSFVMLFAGALGVKDNIDDRNENIRQLELLRERTSSFKELSQKLDGGVSYAEASKEYDELYEKHESASAQHRTDLAINTATRAGIQEARKSLIDASGMVLDAQKQLEDGKKEFDAQKKAALEASGSQSIDEAISKLEETVDSLDGIIAEMGLPVEVSPESPPPAEESGSEPDVNAVNASATSDISGLLTNPAFGALLTDEQKAKLGEVLLSPGQTDPMVQARVIAEVLGEVKNTLNVSLEGLKTLKEYDTLMKMAPGGIGAAWDNINYAVSQLDETEKEMTEKYDELAEEKTRLLKEAVELKEMQQRNSELKSDESRLSSTESLLLSNQNIKLANDNGVDLLTAAENEVSSKEYRDNRDFVLRMVMWGLAAASALCGFISIFGAFEKTKSRCMLIAPVVAYTVFAAAADCLAVILGRGQSYSTLFAAIFGVIQLLVVIPKANKPAV